MATLFFRPDGTIEGLYTESVNLARLGKVVAMERASHVEPYPDDPSKWIADLDPVGGPILGPFDKRSEALKAESDWLNAWFARNKRPACPQARAFEDVSEHVRSCRPCGMLWVGIGKDRYEHCPEYKRLAEIHLHASCTCRASDPDEEHSSGELEAYHA